MWAEQRELLERAKVLETRYPMRGVSSWQSHGTDLCLRLVDHFLDEFSAAGYQEIGLPSVVPRELLSRQAGSIKDFERRLYFARQDQVVASTIEAQVSPVLARWLDSGVRPPLRVMTVRSVARHETSTLRPLWKERVVWPFFEAQTAFVENGDEEIDFLVTGPRRVCTRLGLPVVAVERLRLTSGATQYADRRLELLAVMPNGQITILTSVYDLGKRFSTLFEVKHRGTPVQMLNFAFSARLVLAVLAHSLQSDQKSYHPDLAPIQVVVVPARDDVDVRPLLSALRAAGLRADDVSNGRGVTDRLTQASDLAAPVVLRLSDDSTGLVVAPGKPWHNRPFRNAGQAAVLADELLALAGQEASRSSSEALDESVTRLPVCDAIPCHAELVDRVRPLDVAGICYGEQHDDRPCEVCGAPTTGRALCGTKYQGDK